MAGIRTRASGAGGLGPRSPETDAIFEEFESTVLKARRIRKEKREDVLLTCKLAKAYGAARLHGTFASALDRLWYADGARQVAPPPGGWRPPALFAGTALLGYESGSRTLTPPDLVKEQHLQFIAGSDDPEKMGLDTIAEACGADDKGGRVRVERGRFVIRQNDRIVAEVFRPSYLLKLLDPGPSATLREGLDMPRLRSLVFSRDNRPIEVCTLDPRVYAIAAYALRDEDEIWERRATFVAGMVNECWPDKFDEYQEIAMEGLPTGDGDRWLRGP